MPLGNPSIGLETARGSGTGVEALFGPPAEGSVLYFRGFDLTADGMMEIELRTTPGNTRLWIGFVSDNGRSTFDWFGETGIELPAEQGIEANIIAGTAEFAINVWATTAGPT